MRLLVLSLAAALALSACQTTTTTTVDGQVVAQTSGPTANVPREKAERARARLELAAAYYRSGQMAIALEETGRALELDPRNAAAYGFQGLIYNELGDRAQAESSFARALQIEPANPDINNNYGWLLCRNGRPLDSIAYFDRAIRDPLYATPARALQNAGSCLAALKDWAGAEAYLRRAYELEPGNPNVQYEAARVAIARADLEHAHRYYQQLTRNGENSAAVLWLGVRLARVSGDSRTEARRARELSEKYPGSPEVFRLQKGDFND